MTGLFGVPGFDLFRLSRRDRLGERFKGRFMEGCLVVAVVLQLPQGRPAGRQQRLLELGKFRHGDQVSAGK